MGSGEKQRRVWAAGLALFALVLHALVPVHLAFDLAEALGSARGHSAPGATHSLEWRVLARLMGHEAGDGKIPPHNRGHKAACPAYSAFGTLAGFAPTAPATLSAPVALAIALLPALIEHERSAAPPAGYRSRAPPLA
ncbi:MAG: hypothetical protein ACREFA_10875 [Stellaceae bacterium]